MPRTRARFSTWSRATQVAAATLTTIGVVGATALSVQAISVDRVPAVWGINGEVGESSLVIPIRAAHPDCPSWSTLGGLVVEADETADTVVITATFPEHGEQVRCRWLGAAMTATVKLDEPLGARAVIDGGTGGDPATPVSIAFHTGQSPSRS